MGQFVSYSLSSMADPSATFNRFLPPIYCQSRRRDLLGEHSGDENPLNRDDFEAKFRSLLNYFEDARKAYEARPENGTNGNEANKCVRHMEELRALKQQLSALGDLFDQFLDTSLAMRERTRRMENEWERRFQRVETENAQLRENLEAMERRGTEKNDVGGEQLDRVVEPIEETTINLGDLSIDDDQHIAPLERNVQQQPVERSDANGGPSDGNEQSLDAELVQFLDGLPPVDEQGQLVLNKFKYSCEFVQFLYTGGCRVDSVFCNIFSAYPPTFFEELVEYALTTHRPDSLVRRICVWLAADEPWPDMATLFPSAVQRSVGNDRVLYEFQNVGKSCGQQQRKQSGFVLRIRAPSRRKLFVAMSNFSLCRK